jgi:hypothetical protein
VTLPELSWQILYGRLAWTLVLAALALALLPAPWRRARGAVAALLLGFGACNALPGAAAPSYWLVLGFQLPSALLTALCGARLLCQWQGRAQPLLLPAALAAPLALLGMVLYVDAMGLVALGWYYAGFGPRAAPLVGLLLAAGCTWIVIQGVKRGVLRAYALALLAALCLFAVLRLPTGNLWDALLDPFLVAWAALSAGLEFRRRRRRAARRLHPA